MFLLNLKFIKEVKFFDFFSKEEQKQSHDLREEEAGSFNISAYKTMSFESPENSIWSLESPEMSGSPEEDVLPLKIKETHRKLSFGSVKLDKTATRVVTIQNSSNKNLSLGVKIKGSGFTVLPREDFWMSAKEARSFEVVFSPSVVGASRGELTFELMTNSRPSLSILLFAYGGHASLRITGTQKGPIGPEFITMGLISGLKMGLNQKMVLSNHGTIPQFISLAFCKTEWSDFSMYQSLNLNMNEVHLMPGESTEVKISFNPTKEDVRNILNLGKETTVIGEICIISGDEPTLIRMMKNKKTIPPNLLNCLPEESPYDDYFKRELLNFIEYWDNSKADTIIAENVQTREVSFSIKQSLDETEIIFPESSMVVSESSMPFLDLSMTGDSIRFMTFREDDSTMDQEESEDDTVRDGEYEMRRKTVVSGCTIPM